MSSRLLIFLGGLGGLPQLELSLEEEEEDEDEDEDENEVELLGVCEGVISS